ncbi:MAG: UPF0149 family protein [Fluviicoccus sp.]|uniref:UPF0149 family protein n=1 Tax=Fluviicoccus sp. TaxID=2003552 RepID=UPI002717FC06|nr:UPF0149 family protein [Fluviicoccus sp.]MDO8329654.1 UPF0149 family protein [Fluviicoccus sp.]
MSNQISTQELIALDEFLQSDRCPPDTFNLPSLRGFLWAVVASPVPMTPDEWMPLIWEGEDGEENPRFASEDEAGMVMGIIIALYDEALLAVENETSPLPADYVFNADPDEMTLLIDWCQGFLAGHDWLQQVWDQVCEAYSKVEGGEIDLAAEINNVMNVVGLFAGYPEVLDHVEDPQAVAADLPMVALEVLPQALLAYARTGQEFCAEQLEMEEAEEEQA